MPVPKITIVGAGLGGSLLAIYLARRKYEVHVFERRGDLRREPVEVGRSIKLTLAERGLAALASSASRISSSRRSASPCAAAPSTRATAPWSTSPTARTTTRSSTPSPATT